MDLPVNPNNREVPDIVPLDFWVGLESDPRSGEMREVEWCRYTRRGVQNATTEDKIARLQKSKVGHWTVLRRYYDAWKEQRTVEFEGTPLDAWPGISKDAVEVLRKFHILSIEHLAAASDGVLVKTGVPSIREMARRAQMFLANKDQAAAAARMTAQDSEIEGLKQELASMRALVDFQIRPPEPAVQDDPDTIPARRGPGRPPKVA